VNLVKFSLRLNFHRASKDEIKLKVQTGVSEFIENVIFPFEKFVRARLPIYYIGGWFSVIKRGKRKKNIIVPQGLNNI